MKKTMRLITVMVLVVAAFSFMISPEAEAASGSAVDIGVEVKGAKIGDAGNGAWPTYGPGSNVAIIGNEIGVLWVSYDTWSEPWKVRFVKSTDNGQSWGMSEVLASGGYNPTGLSVAVGKYQGVSMFHFAVVSYPGSTIYYANDSDYTFIDVTGGFGGAAYAKSIAADDNGNVYVCYDANPAIRCSHLITDSTGVSLDPNETGKLVTTNSTRNEPAIAIDSSGNLFGAWGENIGGQWNMVLAKRDTSGSWSSAPIGFISEGDYEAGIAVTDLDAGGKKICVTWWGTTNNVVVCTTDEGANWTRLDDENLVTNGTCNRPGIAISGNGDVSVAWADDSAPSFEPDDIKFMRYTVNGNKWLPATIIDSQVEVCDVKVMLDSNGKAFILYPGDNERTVMYSREK